jgi:FixJ family two-component response regulator
MKYSSLEKLKDMGFIKEANYVEVAGQAEKLTPYLQSVAGSMIQAGMVGGMFALFNSMSEASKRKQLRQNVMDVADSLNKDPAFKNKQDLEKAKARYYELARVAPHLTYNRPLVMELIQKKLNSGFSLEDKQKLALIQATLSKEPNTQQFIPKMASADVGNLVADVVLVKTAAGIKDSLKYMGALSLLPITAMVAGGAVNAGASYVKQKNLKAALEESFVKALNMSDADREPLLQNKDKARQAFGTLSHFAPQVALDPQAARAFMNKIVSYDVGIDMSTVKELSEISKNLSQSTAGHPFLSGAASTAKMVGAPNIIGGGLSDASEAVASSLAQPAV